MSSWGRSHSLLSDSLSKSEGTFKTRLVALGNQTLEWIHYTECATSMATLTAVKLIVSFAAGCGYKLYSVDFSQAFLNAPIGRDDMYVHLPDMPSELLNKGLGSRRGDRGPNGKILVGRLNKALYGLRCAECPSTLATSSFSTVVFSGYWG